MALGVLGGSLAAQGAQSQIYPIYSLPFGGDFGNVLGAKVQSILGVILQAVTHFLVLRFLRFFQGSFFLIFYDFRCPEAPF